MEMNKNENKLQRTKFMMKTDLLTSSSSGNTNISSHLNAMQWKSSFFCNSKPFVSFNNQIVIKNFFLTQLTTKTGMHCIVNCEVKRDMNMIYMMSKSTNNNKPTFTSLIMRLLRLVVLCCVRERRTYNSLYGGSVMLSFYFILKCTHASSSSSHHRRLSIVGEKSIASRFFLHHKNKYETENVMQQFHSDDDFILMFMTLTHCHRLFLYRIHAI